MDTLFSNCQFKLILWTFLRNSQGRTECPGVPLQFLQKKYREKNTAHARGDQKLFPGYLLSGLSQHHLFQTSPNRIALLSAVF